MKLKTLCFGAGPGALVFMKNSQEQRDFIGFIDNDVAKHGNQLQGLTIYPPSDIAKLDFDQIVITTQWGMDVQRQLLDALGLDPRRVVLPQKNQLKNIQPFSNPKSLQLGRFIIKQLSELAVIMKVPLVADFGTLLGLTRDGDIIPWDDDIDFSVPAEFAAQTEALLTDFIKSNNQNVEWRIAKVTDKKQQIAGYWLKFSDPNNSMIEFTTSLCLRQNKNGNSEHMPSLGMWYAPELHFKHFDTIEWQGCVVQVPHQHLEYLTFQYGDWNTPKKDIQLSDYANLQNVDFGDIQNAGFKAQTLVR